MEETKYNKYSIENIVRYIGIVLLITGIIVVIIIKTSSPDFPLFKIGIILGILVFIAILTYFGGNLYKKFLSHEDLLVKKVATREELLDIVKTCLVNEFYMNHVKQIISNKNYLIGKTNKTTIAIFEVKPLYGKKEDKYYILINANHIERLPSILLNPGSGELNKAINMLADEPEEEPNTEELTTFNPTLGITTTQKKVLHALENKKIEEKKEDLA